MVNCSNEYPNTDVFYSEISGDYLSLVLLGLGSVLMLVSVGLFVEELIYLQQVYFQDEVKVRKVATILGVFPVTVITAFLAVVVPTSTFLVDLVQTCYLSVCFYTFVTLAIDYFGGDQGLLDHLGATKVRTALPPCCCCLCCILRPRILTRKSLLVFKLMSLQVAVLRPVLLFIAAVLWTDGKYKPGLDSASSTYIYITAVTSISLIFSMYGSGVIYRAVAPCLTNYRITAKFVSIKLLLIVSNIQTLVFSILAANDQPPCLGSRGPIARGSALNHFCLLIEASVLCLLARRGYRMDERELPPPDKLPGDADNDEDAVNSDKAWFDNIAAIPDSAI
ncbi:organic solute transporter subunit alpha-like [Mya arenaria]|uniref:organic solute transporter subunit alpha-like n=1 Tax=Mya arenaria TaxID=6604 RepID=UPI0022E69EB7|nr:organic solute transporter subunit alpha-like [Mya arenaria]XP_052766562.1 organic solute transporter subunit alpha-like [Mya arenaria]XP_052766563.1 organic solute transporter subunit alpha-like [Mya arenaria]